MSTSNNPPPDPGRAPPKTRERTLDELMADKAMRPDFTASLRLPSKRQGKGRSVLLSGLADRQWVVLRFP